MQRREVARGTRLAHPLAQRCEADSSKCALGRIFRLDHREDVGEVAHGGHGSGRSADRHHFNPRLVLEIPLVLRRLFRVTGKHAACPGEAKHQLPNQLLATRAEHFHFLSPMRVADRRVSFYESPPAPHRYRGGDRCSSTLPQTAHRGEKSRLDLLCEREILSIQRSILCCSQRNLIQLSINWRQLRRTLCRNHLRMVSRKILWTETIRTTKPAMKI